MAVDYTRHAPAGTSRAPFLRRGGGTAGLGRTLADHLRADRAPTDEGPPAAAGSGAGQGAGRDAGRTPFLRRARSASPPRTLADHLAAARAPAQRLVPAPKAAPSPVRPSTPPPPVPPHPALPAPVPVVPVPAAEPPLPTAVVGRARESERRTVLDDDHPVTTLTAADLPRHGRLTVTLSWEPPRSPAGVVASTDVHLGCLWQSTAGDSGVVQSAGGLLSAPGYGARQVLRLGQRTETEGESLVVDLATVDTMARLLLFAHAQRAAPPPWERLGVRLTLVLPSGARVVLFPSAPAAPSRALALASGYLVDGDLVLRREDEAVPGPARDVATAYGWDLDWSADGTTPRR